MTRLIFSLILLLPFFTPLLAASDIVGDKFEEIAGRGLVIRTDPVGVKVFIDGAQRGLTPITFENLTAGEYHIRLSKDGFNDRSFNVTLFNTSRLVVSIEMKEPRGLVTVKLHRELSGEDRQSNLDSIPFKAEINSIALGENADTMQINLPAGFNTIRVRSFGWEDTSVTVLVNENEKNTIDIFMKRAVFKIGNLTQSRKRFNPLNSNNLGITEIRFEVTAAGFGTMKVFNKDGEEVFNTQLENFDTWNQRIKWNGRDLQDNPLPQGVYTILIEAYASNNETERHTLTLETEISYSLNIIPLSLESGISGLTFSPMPHTLPAGSFQLDASFLFGSFLLEQEKNYIGFPFNISMRIAPLKQLELVTIVNINPYINNQTGWGVTGSVKYNFFKNASPLTIALGTSYAWASKNGGYPLSPGGGVSFYIPFSLQLTNFNIVFSTAAFWRGPEGLIPDLLLSAGVLYNGSWLNAGISARYEFDFENIKKFKFLAGAEIRFFPSPSNLVYTIHGGVWTQEKNTGGYGGIKIGMIF
ncbi:MAG: PEGA domain-containing protein [Treponema sp.]|nr:PEGA domain-containing protein [Treponema sp.]MCL2252497.1 PEGA domain-containing protein [Treponema sp.]